MYDDTKDTKIMPLKFSPDGSAFDSSKIVGSSIVFLFCKLVSWLLRKRSHSV